MAKKPNGEQVTFTRLQGNEDDLQAPVNPLPGEAKRHLFSSREKAVFIFLLVGVIGGSVIVTFLNHIAPMPSWP